MKFFDLRNQLIKAIDFGYEFVTCCQYMEMKNNGRQLDKIIINRVDIDIACAKAGILCELFNDLNIKGTFFVRLHAKEYNPFDFDNYLVLKNIHETGHEIGYHSEIVDQSKFWGESATFNLLRDIKVLETILNIKIKGIASHSGGTGYNNLDFWKYNTPRYFDLMYEAYEPILFNETFYISDSSRAISTGKYKCYDCGKLIVGDKRSLGEHIEDNHPIIYTLIHPAHYED